MQTEKDLKASLDKLTAAITVLSTAVQAQADRTSDVTAVDAATAQVQTLTESLTPPPGANG